MKRQQIILFGYLAAAIGIVIYMITKKTGGLMAGGALLVLTSAYNIIAGKKEKDKKK